MAGFRIAPARPSDPQARALIARHVAQMDAQSPEESCHVLDLSGLEVPEVDFYLLWQGDRAIAMGALKTLTNGGVELKSMHTISEARGSGAGRAMLEHLLGLARQRKADAVYLETGSTDDFLPARKLYEGYGFCEDAPFEGYAHDPWSVFMKLDLMTGA